MYPFLPDFVKFGAQIPTAIGVVIFREWLKHCTACANMGIGGMGVATRYSPSKWARANATRRGPGI